MGIIKRVRKQSAVYWPFVSVDAYGKKLVGSPVLIKCRWDASIEEFLDAQGERQLSRAVVMVDRDTPVGGILMLGGLSDITNDTDIKENEGAWEIKRFDNTPDIRAKEFLKRAYL